MYQEFVASAQQYLSSEETVVVAVSGGADSMCLAHLFWRWSKEGGPTVHIGHVNHQLRGKASDEDAELVSRWANEVGLASTIVSIDIKKQGGQSLQDIARKKRYTVLLEICRKIGSSKLATAHHADDQVETFLVNLIRGSGSRGLRGMPRKRQLANGVEVFRPLLGITRQRLEVYCREHNIPWREDESNKKTDYMRNRVRHQLLPAMRQFNSGIDQVLLNTAEVMERDHACLEKLTDRAYEKIKKKSPLEFAPLCLSIKGLMSLDPALRFRVVLRSIGKRAEAGHVDAVLGLVNNKTGSSLDMPGGRVYRLEDAIAFGSEPPSFAPVKTAVPVPGRKYIGALDITVEIVTEPTDGGQTFWIPQDTGHLEVTRRKRGDVIELPGGSKKLKEYMIDKKIPRWLRDSLPVIRCEGEIVWVVGLVQNKRFLEENRKACKKVFIKTYVGKENNNA